MSNNDRVISFEVQITTADDCVGLMTHFVDENGKVGPSTNESWSDEPELHTEDVEITVVRASGARDGVFLTGSQHRDLEEFGGYDAFFNKIVAGQIPVAALASALSECSTPQRQGPRP